MERIILSIALLMITGIANAQLVHEMAYDPDKPFNHFQFWNPDVDQEIKLDFTIQPDGTFKYYTQFVNKKRIDGDTFWSSVQLIDKDGNVLASGYWQAGVNARGVGDVQRRDITKNGKLPRDNYKNAVKIRYQGGHIDTTDDELFWKNIENVATAVIAVTGGGGFALTDIGALRAAAATVNF